MTEKEAIELLKYHSCSHEDIDNPKYENGFLGMLRPFKNVLYESNYHEVMMIVKTLATSLQSDCLDRDVIADLWAICHCTRSWAIDNGGMLRRNKLISAEQIEILTDWVEDISMEIMLLLQGYEPVNKNE
jgi:hypothetical protein